MKKLAILLAILIANPCWAMTIDNPTIQKQLNCSDIVSTNSTLHLSTNSKQLFSLDSSGLATATGSVLINMNATPAAPSLSTTGLSIRGADNSQVRLATSDYGIAGMGSYANRHARGTAALPQAADTNDQLFSVEGWGYGSTGYSTTPKVSVKGYASQTWTDANQGAYLSLWTTPNNSTIMARQWTIEQDGDLVSDLNGAGTQSIITSGTATANVISVNATGGAYYLPYTKGASGQTITLQTDGSTIWQTPTGGGASTDTLADVTGRGATTNTTLGLHDFTFQSATGATVRLTGDMITAASAGVNHLTVTGNVKPDSAASFVYNGISSYLTDSTDHFTGANSQLFFSNGMQMNLVKGGIVSNYGTSCTDGVLAHRFTAQNQSVYNNAANDVTSITAGIYGSADNISDIQAAGKTLNSSNIGFYSDCIANIGETLGTHNLYNILMTGTLESSGNTVTNGTVKNIMLYAFNNHPIFGDMFVPKLGDENYVLLNESPYGLYNRNDSAKFVFGAGDDASLYYNGTNFICNPKEVGTGSFNVLGTIKASSAVLGLDATAPIVFLGNGTNTDQNIITVNAGLGASNPYIEYVADFLSSGYAGWQWTLPTGKSALVTKSEDAESVVGIWSKALDKNVSIAFENLTDLTNGSIWEITKNAAGDNSLYFYYADLNTPANNKTPLTISTAGNFDFANGDLKTTSSMRASGPIVTTNTSTSAVLSVNATGGAYYLPYTKGASGQVVTLQTDGTTVWQTAGGAEADTLATVTGRGANTTTTLGLNDFTFQAATGNILDMNFNTSSTSDNFILLRNYLGSAGARPGIAWYTNTGSMYSARLSSEVGSGYNSSKFYIQVADSTQTLQDRLTIDNKGNVSIGNLYASSNITATGSIVAASTATASVIDITGTTPSSLNSTLSIKASPTTGSASGISMSRAVGEAVVFGDLLFMGLDGKYYKAMADSPSRTPCVAMSLGATAAAATGPILMMGTVTNSSWGLVASGQLIYLSPTTSGGFTQTLPSTIGQQVQIIGHVLSGNTMYFNPDMTFVQI